MAAEFPYLHGTHPDEQVRLSALNELLNAESMRALGLRGGERILDVGCGLAQLTRQMARRAGNGCTVIGIDGSSEQLAGARRLAGEEGAEDLVELREGDVRDLPLRDDEWGTFDVVHTRFLLEHVHDPLAVVRGMVRAARPGGRIVLQDDDHDVLRLWPECPRYMALWRAYVDVFEGLGSDPWVGRHLVSLLHEAGARPTRNDCLFFGGCAGHPSFPSMVANFVGVVAGARAAILDQKLSGEAEFDRGIREFEEWSARPDAAMWYTAGWAEGVRPE